MDKRYQVFISSTFEDLKEARMEISNALLRANCFPAGMELFPAAGEELFEYIKKIVRQSDFYIVVSAGKYGSICPDTGIGYTEMEYDYAVEIGKPIIRLLNSNPKEYLPEDLVESESKSYDRLEQFREKMRAERLVNYWMEPSELPSLALLNLNYVISAFPTSGWSKLSNKALPDSCVTNEAITILEIVRDNPSLEIYRILKFAAEELKVDMRDYWAKNKLQSTFGSLMDSGLVGFKLDMTHYKGSPAMDDPYEFWRYRASELPCKITEFGKEILKYSHK